MPDHEHNFVSVRGEMGWCDTCDEWIDIDSFLAIEVEHNLQYHLGDSVYCSSHEGWHKADSFSKEELADLEEYPHDDANEVAEDNDINMNDELEIDADSDILDELLDQFA